MWLERFLNWLNEDLSNGGAGQPPANNTPKQPLLEAPKPPRLITQRSLPTPQRLWEIAHDYEVRQLQAANDQYDDFLNRGYPNFVQWVESLVEKSATFGGHFLLLTFDNSTGIVTATTPEPREILPPQSYALPISQSAVQRLVTALADHFQRAEFRVQMSRQESACSRLGAQFTPVYYCLDIYWAETQVRCASADILHFSRQLSHS